MHSVGGVVAPALACSPPNPTVKQVEGGVAVVEAQSQARTHRQVALSVDRLYLAALVRKEKGRRKGIEVPEGTSKHRAVEPRPTELQTVCSVPSVRCQVVHVIGGRGRDEKNTGLPPGWTA
ncbi:hypothetical protein NDU88_008284 [Pleurodeles waltl]|uniref:Secreted protein n=1 Tax=Pleurodeles waltl TaxID=8319 RepID=A0AAV7NCM8_PLEWA|nr:hypothetical protein NDU88_008284 [Pleurodeles waltl]